ncbi:hypothetical protein [Aquimarina algiphila]|uniref:hypothetical protein n=1 Tax=Aquimarina algiphila TaxID=2047982 RepID=UPI00232E2236|nr:hypothetical protein [Aquimarina algiphila]
MDKIAQLRQKLQEAVGVTPNLPIMATVIDIQDDHCSVKLTSGLELTDVRLKATISEGNEFMIITPVIGSDVMLLSSTGNLDNLTVIKVDQVQKIEIRQNGLQIITDSSDKKVSVKNDQVSLIAIMTDLATLLKQLKVFTPIGPSGTPLPDSIEAITEFETKFNQLLK